ncbi:hypothetical protein Tco_0140868 [Tanacetum coccineum]
MLIQFVIQNQFFSYTLEEFSQILNIPHEGAYAFIDKWSLDDLQFSITKSGPYKTYPPCPDDIISYIRKEREGTVTLIRHDQEIDVDDHQILTHEIDYGTKRGRVSTSSSSTFGQPSSSHLNDDDDDDDDDGNNEGTLRASTPSPTRFVKSLINEVPRVFQNPLNFNPDIEPFYTCQTEILNRQVQLQDEHRGGLRSIRKGFKNL